MSLIFRCSSADAGKHTNKSTNTIGTHCDTVNEIGSTLGLCGMPVGPENKVVLSLIPDQ